VTASDQPVSDQPSIDPTLTRLARGGSLNLAGALLSGLLAATVYVIVARHYPKPEAGAFFAATALFLILAAVSELGVDTGLLRWLPRYFVERRYADVTTCIRVAMRPVYISSVTVAVVVLVLAPWIAQASVDDSQEHAFTAMLRVLAVGLPISATYDLVLAQTRVHGSMRPTVTTEKFIRVLAQPILILLVELFDGSIAWVAAAWVAPYLPCLFVALAWNRRVIRRQLPADDTGQPARDAAEVRREFWTYTRPRAAARICQVALQRADIVLVAALRSPREAAIYAAASRLLVFGQLGVLAVQQVMQPYLSRMLARDDRVAAESIFQTSTSWLMALAWPAYLVSAAVAPLMLSVFGAGYGAGETTLVILSLTMLVATACGPTDIVLLMAGRSGLSLLNNFAALVVDIGLNLVLIPRYGITGAAISWACALVVRNVLPLSQVRATLHMTPWSGGALWVAGSAAFCFGALPLLLRSTAGLGLVEALPGLAVCTITYAALLWAGRRRIALSAFAGLLRRRVVTPTPEGVPT
jgi:O-antigen/teichoic acid export membrane protein